MKKKLFTLLLCAFAWIGANANEVINGVWYIYGQNAKITQNGSEVSKPSDIDNIQKITPPAGITAIKFVGSFPNGWDGTWFQDNGGVADKANITSIDLSGAILTGTTAGTPDAGGNVTASNKWGFSNFQNTALTVTWPTAGNITVIPDYAFKNTALQSVTIPGYIKTVCSHAFDSSSNDGFLKSIKFDDYDANGDGESDVDMYLGYQAFSNTYAVFDVYIETEGTIKASNMAFPEAITYGQGNVANTLARLHFPDTKAEDYVNQSHTLDQATANDDGEFQKWLVAHYTNANTKGNGWYEFVSNGSSKKPDADMGDAVLYTFSHPTIDYIVPKGAKAFIVGSVKNQGGDYLCELVKVNVIPHGTGVIIFGGTNSKSSEGYRNLEMTAVVYKGKPYDRTPQEVNDVNVVNLLLPSTNAAGETFEIKPYDLTADGKKIEYRNFVFSKFSSSDSGKQYYAKHGDYGTGEGLEEGNYYGFFRTKKGTTKPGKAFLRCLATEDEVFESTCGEIQVLEHPTYRHEYADTTPYGLLSEDDMVAKPYWYAKKNDASSIILWKHKWGTRALAAGTSGAKYFGEPTFDIEEDETTGVAKVVNSVSADETYFNLNGQQVVNPTKGVYIKNGKKVIVK